jgi:glucosamine--fructose-6-phosphate aminotransferase (isomerizing)
MDDLRATLGAFDPQAPLTPAPDPWDYLPMPALRDGPPWAMAEMIAAEPALAARIVRRVLADGSADALAVAIRETASAGRQVVVTGCGTSEHAAMAAAALLTDAWRRAGLPGPGPRAAQAFELALDPPDGGLVIGCSHEGGTTATIAALEAARAHGSRTAVLTASRGAPVTAVADIVVETVEMDRSWCHTVGYVSPMVAAAVAADRLAGDAPGGDAPGGDAPGGGAPGPVRLGARIRDGIEAAHARSAMAGGGRPDETIAATVAGAAHLLVVASGTDRVTARELALKIEEAAWLPSAVRDLETFLHGHLPATGPTTALVLVMLDRNRLETRATRARQALAAAAVVGIRPAAILGADAAALIPAAHTPGGRIVVPEATALAGPAATLLGGAAPLQLLTLALAAERGTNPDPIRRDDPTWLRAAEVADAPEV